jgi:hypothetical protein
VQTLDSPRIRVVWTLAALGLFCLAVYCWFDSLYLSLSFIVLLASGSAIFVFAVLWLLRLRTRRGWLIFELFVLVAAESLLLFAVQRRVHWDDRMGNPGDYDAWNGVCGRAQSVIRGSGGAEATLRLVECTGAPIVPPSRDYFVFVHGRQDRGNYLSTLALAYREWSDDDWQVRPDIKWLDKSELQIGMGNPSFTTRRRTELQGVRIIYAPGGSATRDSYILVPCSNGRIWCDY